MEYIFPVLSVIYVAMMLKHDPETLKRYIKLKRKLRK